jgi:PA14 domain
MKHLYPYLLKLTTLSIIILLLAPTQRLQAQACATAQGNQTTYGTNNVWIGYVYTGMAFNNYQGYVNEGTSSSPDFNEGFGGGGVTYNTNGCSITTDNFSVRYMLQSTLAAGTYVITVGGDDGYRFSMNGDASYIINNWNDHGYTTTTDTVTVTSATTYSMILEYYQDGGGK